MHTKDISKKSVFIASSSKVRDQNLLIPVIETLNKQGYNPRPWYDEFKTGEIIIEDLFRIAGEVDFAICFFAEDIEVKSEHNNVFGTAWNVVLEFGLFLQKLGRERVRIIHYGTSKIPSDLDGIVLGKIKKRSYTDIHTQISQATKTILNGWKNVPALHNDTYGINNSIIKYKDNLDRKLKSITVQNQQETLQFDEKLIVNLYVNGLNNVKERFWTTTYLSSGFWVHKTANIINANLNMLKRLKRNPKADVKRLFLIRREFHDEKEILSKKLVDYKNRKGGIEYFKKLKANFETLSENCHDLLKEGCQIKFVHDSMLAYRTVNNYITVDDTEIAIYDDFRIDFYDGGRLRKITGLKTVANYHQEFPNVISNSEKYFKRLWKDASDIKDLLKEYKKVFDYYENKVDYTFQKIVKFDNDTNKSDADLKKSELTQVISYIKRFAYADKTQRYLDIGTCTGRYLFKLSTILNKQCNIYGFDSDPDCIKYISVKNKILKSVGKARKNLSVLKKDFLLDNIKEEFEAFDLITCMLGTLSHFGWNLKDNFKDDLQKALEVMSSILSDKGVIILSNWSQIGIQRDNLLSIYSQNDNRLLKEGTESRSRLIKRLQKLSLEYEILHDDQRRLDIFFCKKKQPK